MGYRTILIPTDGSSDAMKGGEKGAGLAAALGASVHGLFVVTEGTNPQDSMSHEDQEERATDYGRSVLEGVAELAADAGVDFVGEVRFGPRVYEAINEYVEEADVDLIAMGSGYHGEFGGLLGSTADKVLRTARVPVLVLRRELRAGAGPADRESAAAVR